MEKMIELTTPIKGHGRTYSQVKLREPTARDYIELGEPQQLIWAPNRAMTQSDNDVTISAYLHRCIREPNADIVLAQVTLADAMRIRKGLLDFFTEANRIAEEGLISESPEISADAATPSS
jgi:hypothetical protein